MRCIARPGLVLTLAAGAPVAAAAPQPFPLDRGAAVAAGLAGASIHPGGLAVVAIGAREVAEIAEGGAAGADALLEHRYEGFAQVFEALEADAAAAGLGADARYVEGLIGIDVAAARHQGLV